MTKVFVTGSNGFVGSWVSRELSRQGYKVVAGCRKLPSKNMPCANVDNVAYGDLRGELDWRSYLTGIDALIHTAGFVHRKEPSSDSERNDAISLNEDLVEEIANSAIESGVKMIIHISTIAVHGSGGVKGPVSELTPARPANTYAKTKLGGENKLIQCCKKSSTSWAIIRPAMVYGPKCPGNFSDLVRAVRARIPLPIKNVENRRSFIYIENLVELVALCIQNSAAKNEVFVAADSEVVSVPEVVSWIGEALGIKPWMWPFPVNLMKAFAKAAGMRTKMSSLVDDFVVDARKARDVLDWQPTYDTKSGIFRSVSDFS